MDQQNVLQRLVVGVRVRVICDGLLTKRTQRTGADRDWNTSCKTSIVDEGIIRYVGSSPKPRVRIQVFSGHSKGNFEFGFIRSDDPARRGWRMLLKDPGNGQEFCFLINSPTYRFEVIER